MATGQARRQRSPVAVGVSQAAVTSHGEKKNSHLTRGKKRNITSPVNPLLVNSYSVFDPTTCAPTRSGVTGLQPSKTAKGFNL